MDEDTEVARTPTGVTEQQKRAQNSSLPASQLFPVGCAYPSSPPAKVTVIWLHRAFPVWFLFVAQAWGSEAGSLGRGVSGGVRDR